LKAGFVGFGEINTPREVIEEKCSLSAGIIKGLGIDLINAGTVSDDSEGAQAAEAEKKLKNEEFDFLIVCIAGWIPSYTVLEVVNDLKQTPILLWGLTGTFSNGRLLTTAAQAGTSALLRPLRDLGYKVGFVYDSPKCGVKTDKILSFAKAAHAVKKLRKSKIGMMGYRDMRLYGTMYDGVSLKKKIGTEIEFFEMLEVVQRMESIGGTAINEVVNGIKCKWDFAKEPDEKVMEKGAAIYLAIKGIIDNKGYDGISLIDVDGMKKLLNFPPAMVFMLISNELDKCTVPENDALGAVTQLINKYATGQISAYMEFYEFMDDRVLMGVPDFIPGEITEGKIRVLPTGFGEFDEGLLNISEAKTGQVTLSRLACKDGEYEMHITTGMAVLPGRWEEVGWKPPTPQLPSLEIVLDIPVEDFADEVMSQHYIITYGDNADVLKNICKLLDIAIVRER
jgi:L-fucose isomerase-like protein